jgi:hypothetical protein
MSPYARIITGTAETSKPGLRFGILDGPELFKVRFGAELFKVRFGEMFLEVFVEISEEMFA